MLSKLAPSDILLQQDHTLPKPFQAQPPTRGQVFKCPRIWGNVLFKSLHLLSIFIAVGMGSVNLGI